MHLVSRLLPRVFATALLAIPLPAFAEEPSGPPSEKEGGAEPAPSGPKLVIVLDLEGSATRNSELRAALYEIARQHGYEAAGKVDVAATASRESLMKAGIITVDPAELAELRKALDVSVVVRVSKEGDTDSARVTVVTKRGAHATLVKTTPSGGSEALAAALDDLLPHLEAPAPAAPTKPAPRDGAGSLVLEEKKDEHVVPPREAWERRGGLRPTYGAVAHATALFGHMAFTSPGRNGVGTLQGAGNETGIGGGVGVRVGISYMPIPDPNLSTGGFVAFRLGVGLDADVLYDRIPKHYAFTPTTQSVAYGNRALWIVSAPLEAGFAIAAGHFWGSTSWRGVMLGVAYAPAAQFSMDLRDTKGTFRFNPAGAQASIDITKLDTSTEDAAEMQIRLVLWGLAPLDDAHPGMVSAGIGAIWF